MRISRVGRCSDLQQVALRARRCYFEPHCRVQPSRIWLTPRSHRPRGARPRVGKKWPTESEPLWRLFAPQVAEIWRRRPAGWLEPVPADVPAVRERRTRGRHLLALSVALARQLIGGHCLWLIDTCCVWIVQEARQWVAVPFK